jgi:superfamily II DNA or RNA helicase
LRDAFAPYQEDFEAWRYDGFPGITEASRDYLDYLTGPGHPRPLWAHQQEGFLRSVYAYEVLDWKNQLLNIVTGGGKTAVIATTIAWLRLCHEVRSFLILAPNTIVRQRLAEDFRVGKVFSDFHLLPPHRGHLVDELGLTILGQSRGPQSMLESGVILGNIQQLYSRNGELNRNLAFLLIHLGKLAVFNDEAHNTPAPEYTRVLLLLRSNQVFRLDTTATPDRADGQNPDSDMIYHYGIPQALADGIIKTTVVYQPDIKRVDLAYIDEVTKKRIRVEEVDWEEIDKVGSIRATQWVTDAMPLRYQLKIALTRLEEQQERAQGRYKPILFVVTVGVTDARNVKRVLEDEFGVSALVVTEESDEQERAEALKIGTKESPYDAVVSVLMLREGWDVPEVSVILLLRKFSSRVYGQQVVGRGLRKIVRQPDEREILCVVDHPKLEHGWLWDLVRARVKRGVEDQQRFDLDEDLPEPTFPELVRPELVIEVPDAIGNGHDEVDIDAILGAIVEVGPRKDWKTVLARAEYDRDAVEIADVKLRGVVSVTLDTHGFEALLDAPAAVEEITVELESPSRDELENAVKREALAIVTDALVEDGVGSVHKERVYGVLMDHVQGKLLAGKSLGHADEGDLRFAVAALDEVRKTFRTPGLVAGIVKYPDAGV